jgi:hypothetical protein
LHIYEFFAIFIIMAEGGGNVMTRTTISLHESVLKKVRSVAHQSHTTMGETITELLNLGLQAKTGRQTRRAKQGFRLKTFAMGSPRVPLEDKEAVNALLDGRS